VMEKLITLLGAMQWTSGTYQDWFEVGCALYSIYEGSDEGFERFVQLPLKCYDGYDESDEEKATRDRKEKWQSMSSDGKRLGLSLGTRS